LVARQQKLMERIVVDKEALEQRIRDEEPSVILAVASVCDGHKIFAQETFIEMGLDREIVAALATIHPGPGTARKRVYGLHLVEDIAQAFGIPFAPKYQRNASARWYRRQLREKLAPQLHTRMASISLMNPTAIVVQL
jgi:hypothetical protein